MITGAVIIKNGIKLGYPFVESIRSLANFCDEVIVGVGKSDDGTRAAVEAIGTNKITIIDTVWDTSKRTGGTLLSEKTNEVLEHCHGEWIFYLQSDEVIHEEDHALIRRALTAAEKDTTIDGIAFEYRHFYGSYFTVQTGRNWYDREVRIIRNHSGITSYGDAQGFRRGKDKIRAHVIPARIFHYGWARPPEVMAEKIRDFHKLWHDDSWIAAACDNKTLQDHYSDLGNLKDYTGTHPAVMQGRINRDAVAFIEGCRTQYRQKRSVIGWLRDTLRGLPLLRKRNFIEV